MLSLVDIHKSYGRGERRVQILSEVSLSVAGGEIVGILGPCGEESEALLEVAACAVQPDKGQVRLDQIDLTRLKRARREELRCRHILSVDSRLSGAGIASKVRGYVGLYPLAEHKISNREAAQRAQLGLDQLGISDLAQSPLARLTFWERVLVEFARIVVARPRFVVITELFDGLGAAQAQEARRLLRSLVDEIGCGVLLRAADLTSAWVASRVWRLYSGTLALVSSLPSSNRKVVALGLAGSEHLSGPLDGRSSDWMMPTQVADRIDQMPTISRFLGITISMYYDDHQPPHFHARSGEFNAKVRTDTLELLAGDLPRRELRIVLAWAELHAAELQDNWRRARAGETLLEVEPLQ
jgi:ABC-type lipopolysaccharide export system ATPase subunit